MYLSGCFIFSCYDALLPAFEYFFSFLDGMALLMHEQGTNYGVPAQSSFK